MPHSYMDGIRQILLSARLVWVGAILAVMLRTPATHSLEVAESAAAPLSEAPATATAGSAASPQQTSDDVAIASRFEQADLVAQVRITTVHRVIDNALSEPGMTAILGYVYSAKAQRVYKGEAGTLLAFRVTFDACQEKLKKGEQYLIFAAADTEGRLQVDSCDGILSGADATSLLVYFDGESAKSEREKL
ncbi:hypothetical protein [Microbulbifer aggregans]|uniref:hypothetical protein n=1 Tax=Microbulbifer aggregans TaxID=1769779 RepID=UPI001CFC6A0A|nr:hypothetical protein [Microbulbifer aggregans]